MLINMVLPGAVEPPVDENTLLLLHGEDLTDSSIYGRGITSSGASLDTANKKFGDSSLYFNGNARLNLNGNSYLNFGTGEFTIDWWERPTGTMQGANPFTFEPDPTHFLLYYIDSEIRLYMGSYSGEVIGNYSLNVWTHRAFVRSGDTLYFFQNGTLVWSGGFTGNAPYTQGYQACVGGRSDQAQDFIGNIDEFRVSNVARWTENFTPPTKPYNPGSPPSGGESEPFAFTYSGNYTDNRVDGVGTVRLNTSGTLTVLSGKATVSVYILGGGGGAWYYYSSSSNTPYRLASGGGGGYTTLTVTLTKGSYEIVVGTGGVGTTGVSAIAGSGGDSSAFGQTCTGGEGAKNSYGGQGGSPNGNSGTYLSTKDYNSAALSGISGGSPNGAPSKHNTINNGGDGYVELTFI